MIVELRTVKLKIDPRKLSGRERAVAILIGAGVTHMAIAALLGCQPRTVAQHAYNAANRLGIRRGKGWKLDCYL